VKTNEFQTGDAVNKRGVQGFSMMELVVVLAVIAILATLITPIITSYVDKAKINKAQSDVRNLVAALNQYNSDTKTFPIFTSSLQVPNGTVFDVVASAGLDPAQAPGVTGWISTSMGDLKSMMNENSLLISTVGGSAWNGPYTGIIGEDPWGSKYLVTARALRGGSPFTAFVLSAGPNRMVETQLDQARGTPFTIGGDDIVAVVR
jgi:prepilin-type N-terminal cleavage/methylation domain-containing protein